MQDGSWFGLVAGLVAVAIVVAGAVALVSPPANGIPTATRPSASPTVYRNLSIAYDPSQGSFGYSTTQLAVPAGVAVQFTITNFDPGLAILPTPSDARVLGTVGGSISLTAGGQTTSCQSVPTSDVSHTFSLSDGVYHVNVPIPPASPAGTPTVVTFVVDFATPGTFNWGCAVLCGPGGMMARDAMYGVIVVS